VALAFAAVLDEVPKSEKWAALGRLFYTSTIFTNRNSGNSG
jgi:hypothetical protein